MIALAIIRRLTLGQQKALLFAVFVNQSVKVDDPNGARRSCSLQSQTIIIWHFPFGTLAVSLLTKTSSFNPVFAPNRGSRAVFGLAEYVMPAILLQNAKITTC